MTAYVFVDFGDRFPQGTFSTTVGSIRDVATAQLNNSGQPIPNTVIQGPQLINANNAPAKPTDPTNLYPDNTSVNFTPFGNTPTARAQIIAAAQKAFTSVNVTVVDLTATAQTLVDGRSVRAAANMAEVAATLRGNNTTSKDAYVLVAIPAINPTPANPNGDNPNAKNRPNGYGGISPSGSVLGEITDLRAQPTTTIRSS